MNKLSRNLYKDTELVLKKRGTRVDGCIAKQNYICYRLYNGSDYINKNQYSQIIHSMNFHTLI